FIGTKIFRDTVRDSYRRIRVAIAKINSYLQEHVTGIVVLQLFNREKKAYQKFEKVNEQHMDAFKDAIMAHAVYYPVVEIISAVAIAGVFWFGGNAVLRDALTRAGAQGAMTLGIVVAFTQFALRILRPM